MYQITYTVGTETKKILVDNAHYHKFAAIRNLIKYREQNTEFEIKVIDEEYIGEVYDLPVVQPIGNILEIGETPE